MYAFLCGDAARFSFVKKKSTNTNRYVFVMLEFQHNFYSNMIDQPMAIQLNDIHIVIAETIDQNAVQFELTKTVRSER